MRLYPPGALLLFILMQVSGYRSVTNAPEYFGEANPFLRMIKSNCAKRLFTSIFVLAFILLFSIPVAQGTDYYVSAIQGNDENPGTSAKIPWKTIDKVSKFRFKPGDRILLRRGDIWRSEIKCSSSGTESAKIVFSCYGKGPRPKINASMLLNEWRALSGDIYFSPYRGICNMILEDGNPLKKATRPDLGDGQWYYDGKYIYYRPTSGSVANHYIERTAKGAAFWIIQKANLIIDGLELYGANTAAVLIRNSSDIEIRNCVVKTSGKGISISLLKNDRTINKNIIIKHNLITLNGDGIYFFSPSNGPYQVADGGIVSQNTISETNYDLVWGHYSKDGHAIGIQNTNNVTFSHNTIADNYSGIALWTHAEVRSDNNRFYGNYISDNQRFGIAHAGPGENNTTGNFYAFNIITNNGSWEGPDGGLRINRKNEPPNYFVNNTLYGNDINIYLNSLADKTLIYNNISCCPKQEHVAIAERLRSNTLSRNLYYPDGHYFRIVDKSYTFQEWKRKTGYDGDSLLADPMFVGAEFNNPEDFKLKPASPAIGKGKNISNIEFLESFAGKPPHVPLNLGAFQSTLPIPPRNLKIDD